jgi:hypothetical protein
MLSFLLARTHAPHERGEQRRRVQPCYLRPLAYLETKCVNNQYVFVLVRCGEIAEPRCLGFPFSAAPQHQVRDWNHDGALVSAAAVSRNPVR